MTNILKQGDFNLNELLKLLKENSPDLSILDLRYKNLGAEQIRSLCESLEKNTNLKTLYIAGNIIDDFRPIENMLVTNSGLERVDMSADLCYTSRNASFCNLEKGSIQMIHDAIEKRPVAFDQFKILGNFSKKEEKSIFDHVKTSQARKPFASGANEKPSANRGSLRRKRHSDIFSSKIPDSSSSLSKSQGNLRFGDEDHASEAREVPEVFRRLEKDEYKAKGVPRYFKRINLGDVQVVELISGVADSIIANCIVDGWKCAVKIVSLKSAYTNSEVIRGALIELKIYSGLPPHPNIARYLFHQKTETSLKIFLTKYSTSLRGLISKKRSALPRQGDFDKEDVDSWALSYFSPSDLAFWLLGICKGVEHLHNYKIVHCDLKPDNILCMFTRDRCVQNVVISDFNSAKLNFEHNYSSNPVGTMAYMCPEVLLSKNHHLFSYEADVWSIGMTLYEMMTLKEPYEDEDLFQVPDLIRQGVKPRFPKFVESRYGDLVDIYYKCVKMDPKDRLSIKKLIRMINALIY